MECEIINLRTALIALAGLSGALYCIKYTHVQYRKCKHEKSQLEQRVSMEAVIIKDVISEVVGGDGAA